MQKGVNGTKQQPFAHFEDIFAVFIALTLGKGVQFDAHCRFCAKTPVLLNDIEFFFSIVHIYTMNLTTDRVKCEPWNYFQ